MTQQTSITKYENILSQEDIGYLLNLQEVKRAREDIYSKDIGKIYFSIELPPKIQQKISQIFNINVTKVPMRWIKGDTPPHEDKGMTTFMNTYLIYLTDSQGSFIVDGNTYPITQNTGYVFSEGLKHETINTGSEPRLLLGPMSEQGFAVGSSIGADGGSTIYFGQVDASGNPDPSANIRYKVNDGEWISIGNNYPMYISNYNTSLGFLNIEFFTDLIIDNNFASGINKYFICGSEYIQFGKSSLKSDGTRPIITISEVTNYQGLFQNGSQFSNGNNNIQIYNLIVNSFSSSLANNGGWLCQSYFARQSTNNFIINCSSNGTIAQSGGGICGSFAGFQGELTIIGCSSSGQISSNAGGIVGQSAGLFGGSVDCSSCFSTGDQIDFAAGGIVGSVAGQGGSVTARKCFSTGFIFSEGGGIFGDQAGKSGSATAINCYSRGSITLLAGGIFGDLAASSGGSTRAENCYSSGQIDGGGGIYGGNAQGGAITLNCYSANNSWSKSTANSNLQGVPISNKVGAIWIETTLNSPYELNNFGYTPYDISNINISNNSLIQSYNQTINAGGQTIRAKLNNIYQILDISKEGNIGSYPTITINGLTGLISTTSGTTSGLYTIYVRNLDIYNSDGYHITQFNLTVNPSSSSANEFSQLLLLLILLKNRRKMISGNFYNNN